MATKKSSVKKKKAAAPRKRITMRVLAAGPPARPARRGAGAIIDAKLRVEINSKTDLRRVIFGLEKHVTGGKVQWKIQFELLERKSATTPYGSPLVKIDLELLKELEPAAEKITKAQKLTVPQAAHAIGPGGDDQKAAKAGELPQEDADATVQDTVRQ